MVSRGLKFREVGQSISFDTRIAMQPAFSAVVPIDSVNLNPLLLPSNFDNFAETPAVSEWVETYGIAAGLDPRSRGVVHSLLLDGMTDYQYYKPEEDLFNHTIEGRARYFLWTETEVLTPVELMGHLARVSVDFHPWVFSPEYSRRYALAALMIVKRLARDAAQAHVNDLRFHLTNRCESRRPPPLEHAPLNQ